MEEKTLFNEIREDIMEYLEKCYYDGDLSDIGNEIGVAVGEIISKRKIEEYGFTAKDFIDGFKHGISLTDGRIKRGLFRTKDKKLINADLNGALNILKKAVGEFQYSIEVCSTPSVLTIKYN